MEGKWKVVPRISERAMGPQLQMACAHRQVWSGCSAEEQHYTPRLNLPFAWAA